MGATYNISGLNCTRFLARYMSAESGAALDQMLASEEEIEIEFKEYNWKLNKL